MLNPIDFIQSAQSLLRSRQLHRKSSNRQLSTRAALTLVAVASFMIAYSSNAAAKVSDFYCGTDQHGVFRATMGKMVCPGGASTDIPVSSKRVFCMYTAVCLPYSNDLKRLVEEMNPGEKFTEMKDDDINHAIIDGVKKYNLHPSAVQASIQCISDEEGGCPKVNECVQMPNGGTFGWGFAQHGEDTQGFSAFKSGGQVPAINSKSNR